LPGSNGARIPQELTDDLGSGGSGARQRMTMPRASRKAFAHRPTSARASAASYGDPRLVQAAG